MLPWSFFIPGALVRAWRDRHHQEGQTGLFLLIWAGFIFLFFSKSNSKLIPYILPIFPPLAILVAHRINNLLEGRGRELKGAAIMLGATLAILGLAALGYARLPQLAAQLSSLIPRLTDPLNQFVRHAPNISTTACVALGVLFLVQGAGTLLFAGRNPRRMLAVLCLCAFLLEILVPRLIMGGVARTESPRDLALAARSLAGLDTRIVTFGPMQGISWYMQRRVMVTGKIDELEFGSKQGDQTPWFPDRQALLKLWGGASQVLVILNKREFDELLPQLKTAPRVVRESGRRLLISNR
jgi:hypothetical protein